MKKRYCLAAAGAAVMGLLGGCGKAAAPETIQISLWSDERHEPLIAAAMEAFCAAHADEVTIEYVISYEGEDTAKETILSNPQGAADIFAFADDQLDALYRAGCLLEVTEDTEGVLNAIGGATSGAAGAIMRDGKVWAYPVSAGNGYFLYYNSGFLNDADVETLDGILDAAARSGRKFTMDFGSGWYIYSFFKGAGLDMTADASGEHNICNWNATDTPYRGVDVAEAMLAVANHDGFISLGDDGFVEGVESGEIVAGINGAWNAERVAAAWGEDYAAVKLPTYTLAGDQVQMCSFMGYKLIGVSAYTAYPEWCQQIAAYLTSEEQQLLRFTEVGECPANLAAASRPEVQASPAVAAISAQSAYGFRQDVADAFWDASKVFGVTISGGNRSGQDLQALLDETVAEITR